MTHNESGERRVRHHPFKRRDVERAMKSARAEGMDIGAVEVVTRDGTRIRVLGKNPAEHTANPWDTVLDAADQKRTS